MKNIKLTKAMMVAVLGSVLMSGSAFAQETVSEKAKSTANETSHKVDSSMKKVDNYMGDAAVTAKVKSALLEAKDIKSTDISVETTHSVVFLTGHVENKEQSDRVEKIAGAVDGVKSVKNDLEIKP